MKEFGRGCGGIAATAFMLLAVWLIAVTAGVVFVARHEIVTGVRGVVNAAAQTTQIIIRGGPVLVAGVLVVILWIMVSKRRNENRRARDGQYAAEWVRVGWGFWPWQRGDRVWFDPNDIVGWGVRVGRDGIHEIEGVFTDAAHQLEMFRIKQARNAIQAMYPGDAAHIDSETPVKPPTAAAGNKVFGGGKPIKVLDPEPPRLIAPGAMPGITDGMQNDTPRAFTLGYHDDGEIERWRPGMYPHVRAHGKSQGAGKTNLQKTIAAAALNKGAHVVVTDLRNFKNWQDFKGRVEMVDANDLSKFADVINAIHTEFKRRDRMLGEHGAPDIESLPGEKLQRILLIIGEFGVTWKRVKAAGLANEIEPALVELAQMSGACFINICAEDQAPGKDVWPRELTVNATPIAGYNEEIYRSLVGHKNPHTIPPYSFSFEGGKVFKTWDMTAPDAKQIITGLPQLNGYRVMQPTPAQPVRQRIDPNGYRTPIPERTNASNPTERNRTPGATAPDTPPLAPTFDVRSADKRDAIRWYIANVGNSQAECRRWLAANGVEVSKGYVSDVYNGKFDDEDRPPATVETAFGAADVIDMNTVAGRTAAAALGQSLIGKDVKVS